MKKLCALLFGLFVAAVLLSSFKAAKRTDLFDLRDSDVIQKLRDSTQLNKQHAGSFKTIYGTVYGKTIYLDGHKHSGAKYRASRIPVSLKSGHLLTYTDTLGNFVVTVPDNVADTLVVGILKKNGREFALNEMKAVERMNITLRYYRHAIRYTICPNF